MMQEKNYQLFWDYYLGIEKDLYSTVEFVEPTVDNYSVYSQFYAKIINTACSEIDVLFKEICKNVDNTYVPNRKNENIQEYKKIILTRFPKIQQVELQVIRGKTIIRPFENWDKNNYLSWWRDYQQVKHCRADNYKLANLYNAIFAVGGLRVLEMYLIRMFSKNQYVLGNHDGPFFRSEYTSELLLPGANNELPDFNK